jgi:hypothetical protein
MDFWLVVENYETLVSPDAKQSLQNIDYGYYSVEIDIPYVQPSTFKEKVKKFFVKCKIFIQLKLKSFYNFFNIKCSRAN